VHIPPTSVRVVESTIIDFCQNSLNIEICQNDISSAHRIVAGLKDTIRPVVVRFTTHRVRDEIYRARKILKDSNDRIYISEHLTRQNAELFYEARKLIRLKKLNSAWTLNGLVFVKFTTDPTEKHTLIRRLANLNTRRA